jgi:fatty-acyl-CoA synthase
MPTYRPTRLRRAGLKGKDTCLFVYTSGTTGMPKAAKLTHARVRTLMRNFIGPCEITPKDRILEALPLYHATGGVCAVGAALMSGASLILERKFSASRFWDDAALNGATLFVYIGEICRYLLNQPKRPPTKPTRSAAGSAMACAAMSGRTSQTGSACRTSRNSTARPKAMSAS